MTRKESLGFTVISLLMPCLLLGLQAGCTTPTASERQHLQGTWEGVELHKESGDKIAITITGNSLHFQRLGKKEWHETTFTLSAKTNPQQLRATLTRSYETNIIGGRVRAIFKIEDGTLTLAGSQDPVEPPKTFGEDEPSLFRYQLRKVQPRKVNAEASSSK